MGSAITILSTFRIQILVKGKWKTQTDHMEGTSLCFGNAYNHENLPSFAHFLCVQIKCNQISKWIFITGEYDTIGLTQLALSALCDLVVSRVSPRIWPQLVRKSSEIPLKRPQSSSSGDLCLISPSTPPSILLLAYPTCWRIPRDRSSFTIATHILALESRLSGQEEVGPLVERIPSLHRTTTTKRCFMQTV